MNAYIKVKIILNVKMSDFSIIFKWVLVLNIFKYFHSKHLLKYTVCTYKVHVLYK